MPAWLAVGLLVALAMPRAAHAECPDGQVIGPFNAGNCCWPAQSWSPSANACVGPPQCPAGFAQQGMNCVRTQAAAPQPATTQQPVPAAAQPASAAGQPSCAGGRVASAATQGRCCWPGQTWSDANGRCSGPPACPAGFSAYGDDCVAVAGAPAPAPASPQVYQSSTPVQPVYATPHGRRGRLVTWEPYHGGPVPPNGRLSERRRVGGFAWGVFFFAVGATMQAIETGLLYDANSHTTFTYGAYSVTVTSQCAAGTAWLGFLPVIGAVLAPLGTASGDCGYNNGAQGGAWALGLGALVFELAGLGLMKYGRSSYPVVIYNNGAMGHVDRSPRQFVLPGAGPTAAGLTLGVRTF